MDIHFNPTTRDFVSPLGGPPSTAELPLFPYSAQVPVVLTFVDDDLELSDILQTGWTAGIAVSTTADESDTPEIRVLSADVTVNATAQTLTFAADCLTATFLAAITGQADPVDAWMGIKLYGPGDTQPKYAFRAVVRLDNVVYDDAGDPPSAPLSDYYTKDEITSLHSTYDSLVERDLATSPSGSFTLGKVYRLNSGAWTLADPDDSACETCELWLALGTTIAAGMTSEHLVLYGTWTTAGIALWLDENGGMTETEPTAETHAGKVKRLVGWVRNADTLRFCGHVPGTYFEVVSV